ncbi:hypothetical protein QTN23_06970 [Pseudomonas shirazica]|uniref:hypothetical protein n=1 Tax=Pseudomonas shirazica TaxID=1940636 RepID=UPI0025A99671|nr:hypothetical protein [Pseudomonas shirazica]MDM9599228.1 hypothetical protein [Pseudomonas shirazica]MDO2412656.1 hypothetical protein [Pseudomonas shirazica]
MKLPLPTYKHSCNPYLLLEAVYMFVNTIDEVIKSLITQENMRFHGRNHLIQLIMYRAGMFMSEESFHDVERYLGDEGADALLRDYGVDYERH